MPQKSRKQVKDHKIMKFRTQENKVINSGDNYQNQNPHHLLVMVNWVSRTLHTHKTTELEQVPIGAQKPRPAPLMYKNKLSL